MTAGTAKARAIGYAASAAMVAGFLVATPVKAAVPAVDHTVQALQAAQPAVVWRSCEDGFQCARVSVPLDYDRPQGQRIELALIRLPATNATARIGSLFVNPGGPGDSGVQFVRVAARIFYSAAVRARFDIVGFDPRGVGSSTAVRCFATSAEQQRFYSDYVRVPETQADFRQAVAKVTELSRRCSGRVGWLLPHLSTADVARDLDILRAAVGDRQLSYLGYSYGTYLGATYANLFPRRVRALALDGVTDAPAYTSGPMPSTTFTRLNSHLGSSATLSEFFRLCAQPRSGCAFGTYGSPARKYAALARRLRAQPLALPDGSSFGYSELITLTVETLYAPSLWDELALTLEQLYAATRPGRDASAAARIKKLPGQGARATADTYDNSIEAGLASFCSETRNPRQPQDYRRVAARADQRAPYVGAYWTYLSLACARWPARAQDRYAGPWTVPTANPILLLNPRFDPATPHRNAVTMSRLLPGSRLVTVNGWGHTTAQIRSACADAYVARYLIRRTLPGADATCPPGIVPFR